MAMLIVLAIVGCKSNKDSVAQENSLVIELPCENESHDDDQYYRALGTSAQVDIQSARKIAYLNAMQNLTMKIAELLTEEVSIVPEVVCEKITFDKKRVYHGYIVIQVAKDSVVPQE